MNTVLRQFTRVHCTDGSCFLLTVTDAGVRFGYVSNDDGSIGAEVVARNVTSSREFLVREVASASAASTYSIDCQCQLLLECQMTVFDIAVGQGMNVRSIGRTPLRIRS